MVTTCILFTTPSPSPQTFHFENQVNNEINEHWWNRSNFTIVLTFIGTSWDVHRKLTVQSEWFPVPLYNALGLGPQQSQLLLRYHRFGGLKWGIQGNFFLHSAYQINILITHISHKNIMNFFFFYDYVKFSKDFSLH